MSDSAPPVSIRPFVIRQVALALAATGMLLLVIAVLALGAILAGLGSHTLSITLLCTYSMLLLGGLGGGLFHLLMARSFYGLNKIAYQWVRSTGWNPLVAIVSNLGRALDAPDVRSAFHLD